MKNIILSILGIILLASCANIFNGLVLPNQCKKCELINISTNEVLFTNEGCGSDNTGLEEEAQVQAYEMSRGFYGLCDLEVRCETWRQDPEKDED
jgi:hypothetical protein